MKINRSMCLMLSLVTFVAIFTVGAGICLAAAPEIAAGTLHTVTLKGDGSLWAWGNNDYGQLGDGTVVDRWSPLQLGTDTGWSQIGASSGGSHTIALKRDGTLWAWGENDYGQLGDGTFIDRRSPVQTGADTDWTRISAGGFHTMALKSDGTLWAWGHNDYGELGDGTFIDRRSPVQTGADTDWAQISAGGHHTIALKSDGTLWAWGYNSSGQVGDGTVVDRRSPVQIGTDTDWTRIFAGGFHNMALKSDGTLWAWGRNSEGQLGDGTFIGRNSPVQIGADIDWAQISAGGFHTIALKNDGTLWAWGYNDEGQLGDGTVVDRRSPVQIGTDTDWAQISAGGYHTMAVKNDGVLWGWGYNQYGQVGDGTVVDRWSPVQIISITGPMPLPIIKANGQENSVVLAEGTAVSITVSLNPGEKAGHDADLWIVIHTPFASPLDWQSFVYQVGWIQGINRCIQLPLFEFSSLQVLNQILPKGRYTFYFAVDDPDGYATGPWWGMDSVEVTVN